MLIGTPNYMSPEQVRGDAVDHRSDIFAVGLVLYELLVYRQAFEAETQPAVLMKILSDHPAPLAMLDPMVDAGVATIVYKALAKNPADRYQDLGAMKAELVRTVQRLETEASDSRTMMVPPPPPRGMHVVPATPPPATGGAADRVSRHFAAIDAALAAGDDARARQELQLATQAAPGHPRLGEMGAKISQARTERELARFDRRGAGPARRRSADRGRPVAGAGPEGLAARARGGRAAPGDRTRRRRPRTGTGSAAARRRRSRPRPRGAEGRRPRHRDARRHRSPGPRPARRRGAGGEGRDRGGPTGRPGRRRGRGQPRRRPPAAGVGASAHRRRAGATGHRIAAGRHGTAAAAGLDAASPAGAAAAATGAGVAVHAAAGVRRGRAVETLGQAAARVPRHRGGGRGALRPRRALHLAPGVRALPRRTDDGAGSAGLAGRERADAHDADPPSTDPRDDAVHTGRAETVTTPTEPPIALPTTPSAEDAAITTRLAHAVTDFQAERTATALNTLASLIDEAPQRDDLRHRRSVGAGAAGSRRRDPGVGAQTGAAAAGDADGGRLRPARRDRARGGRSDRRGARLRARPRSVGRDRRAPGVARDHRRAGRRRPIRRPAEPSRCRNARAGSPRAGTAEPEPATRTCRWRR